MFKIRLIRQIVALIALISVGCSSLSSTPLPEQMDKSPFTGDPCAAPCWQGLVIGRSSENEVLSRLPTLTFIDPNSTQLFREGSKLGLDPKNYDYAAQIVANCIYPEEQCLVLRTVDYTLTEIEIVLNYEITVGEAIGYLGVPDYVGYQKIGLEPASCEINIVWLSRQMVLASTTFEGHESVERCGAVKETGKIESDLLISKAIYKAQEAIEILLVAGSGTEFFEFTETLP